MITVTVTVNPALDVAVTIDHLVPNDKLRATGQRRDAGGGGVNVGRVLHRLGTTTRSWVAVGGSIGDELVGRLDAEGLDPVVHHLDGMTRESISIREVSTGRQYRIVTTGPEIADPEGVIEAVVAAAVAGDVVVLSGGLAPGLPDTTYATIVERLGPEVTTVLDCSGGALARAVEAGPTVVKPSRRELASLVDWTPADEAEIELAARQVLARGRVGALVVSLGAIGAVLVRRDQDAVWFTAPTVEPVSTVGAGDSMVGGMVAALVAGEPLADACRRGVAAGTAAAVTPGTELCQPDEVDRLARRVVVSTSPRGESNS